MIQAEMDKLIQEGKDKEAAKDAKIAALVEEASTGVTNTFSHKIENVQPVQPWAKMSEQSKPVSMAIVALEEKVDKLKEELRFTKLKMKVTTSALPKSVEKTLKYQAIKAKLKETEAKYQDLKEELQNSIVEGVSIKGKEEILGHCYAGLGFADTFTEKMQDHYFIGIESIKLNFANIIKCLR